MRKIAVALTLMLSVAGFRPLSAQQPEPDSAETVPLPPVEVTILRTPFAPREIPFAVSAVRREGAARSRSGLGLDDVLAGVPGVQIANRYNYSLGERISIRGFGARAQFGVRGIKVFVDGIPATLPDGQTTLTHVYPGFVDRTEVMRGPASAIYGNAAGGVIRFETAEPPSVPFRQRVRFLGGANGLRTLASSTAGRSGRWSYVLGLARFAYDGYRPHGAAEKSYANAHVGYRFPESRLEVSANFVDYTAQNPGTLSDSLLAVNRFATRERYILRETGEAGYQGQLGLNWRRAFSSGELALSGYATRRVIRNPIPPSIIDLERTVAGTRALWRARSAIGGRMLHWTVGVTASLQLDSRKNFVNEQGDEGALTLSQLERVLGAAAFAQASLAVSERLNLLGGLRYDVFRFSAEDRLITAGNPDDSGRRTMDAVSPSLGLLYRFAESAGLYANVGTAFETPTTTELVNRPSGAGGFNPALEPQRALSVEIGVKGRAASVGSYQIALYRARIRNSLIPFEVPGAPGRQYFRNTGSSIHRGIEIGTTLRLHSRLTADIAYSFIHARFDDYATDDASYNGNLVPGVAPHRLTASLAYEHSGGTFLAVETRYASEMFVNDENTAAAPGYTVTDLRGGFAEFVQIAGVGFAPFMGVTNVFDTNYITSVAVNGFGGNYFVPGPGRAAYFGMRLEFTP